MRAQCVRCLRVFAPKQNQSYGSGECRSKASYERQESQSRQFWESAEPISLSPQAAALNERERVLVVIVGNAPPNALGYRVGAPNRFTPEAKQYLRWFPSAEQQWPCLFTIQPYQYPRFPAPDLYLVAYLTPEGTHHRDRYFKMLIPFFEPRVTWSRGDRKLILDPPALRL